MRGTAIISASFAALAAAAPPATEAKASENIEIQDFLVRKDVSPTGTKINVVDFKLSGDKAKRIGCTAQSPAFPAGQVATCGQSKYSFALKAGTRGNEFALQIYHDLDPGGQLTALGNVPTTCRAGGSGPGDYVCSQSSPKTLIVISRN